MKTRLAVLLWAATPERPELCATPFVLATAAAALDCDVEIHFAGRATRLLVAGVAERLFPTGEAGKSVHVFMKEAANLGVRFLGCGMALKGQTAPEEEFIAEYAGSATVTDFALRALDPEWATLVF
jgi:predicted peroxiredoxin